MDGKFLTFSNFLSILRILLIPPFLYFLHQDERLLAFVVMLIAIATDWFDGQVARWTNTVSDFGKVLDPLADKLCALGTAGYFLWIGEIPIWFAGLVVFRDFVIFIGGIIVKSRYKIITTALPTGKWAVGFMAMMFIVMVWPNPPFVVEPVKMAFMYAAALLLMVSFVQYLIRVYHIVNGQAYRNL
ncbi:CDP-alcohol phosphatidyltransferase [Chloroherpeton thalassium ATCC 35110]|uniref:CDP-diacylglycerol--glycerol-3-phosphate 3-phosphatidyltransferase n=1 Tax=Chloroherpeton thalassium (strain ATCC 35110 / GB-78) TaxID=517418 RepID=B3QTQ1_CHLT3|nr:CDP-alcohol phosphatidyltransferase family protein [Chloroherpeton thalassium]ACF14249.1 CDP-alcohol phosphatidyltransferase [Chloroherpeton thalassium ATCC 35110]